MAGDLDYKMKNVKVLINDLEGPQVRRRNYVREGVPELLRHITDIGVRNFAELFYNIGKSYMNDEPEEDQKQAIEYFIKLFMFMHVSRINRFGMKVAERIEPAFIDFQKKYSDRRRALLTRDVSQVGVYVIDRMASEGLPYSEYIMNHAVINEWGLFAGEIRSCTSAGVWERGKVPDREGVIWRWPGTPIMGPREKLEGYKYLLYTFGVEPCEAGHIQDNDAQEMLINEFNEENNGVSFTLDELKKYKAEGLF